MPEPDLDALLMALFMESVSVRMLSLGFKSEIDLEKLPSGKMILALEPRRQAALVRHAVGRTARAIQGVEPNPKGESRYAMGSLFPALFKLDSDYSSEDLCEILGHTALLHDMYSYGISMQPALKHVKRYLDSHGPAPEVRTALEALLGQLPEMAKFRTLRTAVVTLLGPNAAIKLETGDRWSEAVTDDLAAMSAEERPYWNALLKHAALASTGTPTAGWIAAARKSLTEVKAAELETRALRWFALASEPEATETYRNTDLLRGLIWFCTLAPSAPYREAITRLIDVSFAKLVPFGTRSYNVGGAGLYFLSKLPAVQSVAELARVRQRCKQPKAQLMIDKALDAVALREGISREQMEETCIPCFGLDSNGGLRIPFGEYTAAVSIDAHGAIGCAWERQDGKKQNSIPAEVKRDHAEALQSLTQTLKEMKRVVPAQRERIENLLRAKDRRWTMEAWREHYRDHPVLQPITRRLIWSFESADRRRLGIWNGERIVDQEGRPVDWLDAGTEVRLWSPVLSDMGMVLVWRQWLEEHGVTQPFKQAHREVYLVTDAERATGFYSNRFAAHILKQHALRSLCEERGWRYQLQGQFDRPSAPSLTLAKWGLRAELHVETPSTGGAVSPHFIYLFVRTGPLRFTSLEGVPVHVDAVPAQVFSEVMRDVDLFVGLCSVGADPEYGNDPHRPFLDYWCQYSQADLTAMAETRRDLLERLLPRLKIGARCRLESRYLVVQGKLHTYRVHLGSAGVMIIESGRGVCIVLAPSLQGPRSVALPFEGDRTLSMILSKAFLLVDDDKITDKAILRQIAPASI